MLVLMVSSQIDWRPRRTRPVPPPKDQGSLDERVERLVGLLNYGDDETARQAVNRMMSLGPSILPPLFEHLLRLEKRQTAMSGRCQLLVEELLTSFGVQLLLQAGPNIARVDRSSPAYPALLRLLRMLGPEGAYEVLQTRARLNEVTVRAPYFAQLGVGALNGAADYLESERFRGRPSLVLPLAANVDAVPVLYAEASSLGRERMLQTLLPWLDKALTRQCLGLVEPASTHEWMEYLLCHDADLWPRERVPFELVVDVGSPALVLERVCHLRDEAVTSLAEALGYERVDKEGVELALEMASSSDRTRRHLALRLLGRFPSDPRAVEYLRALAANPQADEGALALLILADACRGERDADWLGPFDEMLQTRVRGAEIAPEEIWYLRLAVDRRPGLFQDVLIRLLRYAAIHVVHTAALLFRGLHEVPLDAVLHALGRQRYSPAESLVAALLFGRWPAAEAAIVAGLESEDRDVRQASIDLLPCVRSYGWLELLPELIKRHPQSAQGLLNGAEAMGKPAAAVLLRLIEEAPVIAREHGVNRRLRIVGPA